MQGLAYIISVWIMVCMLQPVSAQKFLKIGDRLPEHTFIHLINYPTSTARVSDFRGKPLLLDFWGTGCTACVASWPKLEQLKREFAGSVQILLVNPWQNEEVVRSLIDKRRAAGIVDLTLPTVCEDRALLNLFDVATVPHIVWVDVNGVIRSITGGSQLNAKNIRAMLAGNVTMPQKELYERQPDVTVQAPDDRVLWQSTFSSYRRGLRTSMDAFAHPEMGYFIRVLNFPSRELYRYAYSRDRDRYGYLLFVPRSRVQLATRDSLYIQGGPFPHVDTSSYYCYELVSGRLSTLPQLQARMQHDLEGQFPWKARWEKQVKRCIVLTATDTARLRYTGGRTALNINDVDFHVNKVTITDLIHYLEAGAEYGLGPYPFVDETNFHDPIGGITLSVNVKNFEALRQALRPHGLWLELADRTVDMLVIRDR